VPAIEFSAIAWQRCTAARRVGDNATYVITRNITTPTSVHFKCQFCAFQSKTSKHWPASLFAVARRDSSARGRSRARAATSLHAGAFIPLHRQYLSRHLSCREIGGAGHPYPRFSPLEIQQGAQTLGLSLHDSFPRSRLPACTLPERPRRILDESGAIICPTRSIPNLVRV